MYVHAIRAALFELAILTTAAFAPVPAAAQATVPIKLTVVVAGRTETLRGTGRCAHEPRASIYGRPSALWSAEYAGSSRRVTLTYWRAHSGAGDQFALSVGSGKAQHRINTVEGSTPAGSGRGTFRPTAAGGRFELRGTAADGTPLQVTIECGRFDGIYAEGG